MMKYRTGLVCLLAIPLMGAQAYEYDARIGEKEILTPVPSNAPVINGATVYGARPDKPFVYRIPCQGERPIRFKVEGLPQTLAVSPEGVVSGRTPAKAGEYSMLISASNGAGSVEREFTLVVGETLALTPPTGWNSWGGHMINVSEELIRNTTDFMVESGLADVGFQYINLDDCWMRMPEEYYQQNKDGWLSREWKGYDFEAVSGGARDEYGRPRWNGNFHDVKGMTDYVHSKGLKCGLYSSPGQRTCQNFEGSFGYEAVDAKAYADWGFDFLKYDLCGEEMRALRMMGTLIDPAYDGADNNYPFHQIAIWYPMAFELEAQDRDILLNLCQYGQQKPETWAPQLGYPTWRMGGDLNHHVDRYIKTALEIAVDQREYQKPGQWGDPDYMYIHCIRNAKAKMEESKEIPLNTNQRYQYVSLWSVVTVPFFFSCDMDKIDEFTVRLLSNNEILNINQDRLGHVAEVVRGGGELVMLKKLADGSKVLAVLNATDQPKDISVNLAELGIEKATVRDVWRKRDLAEVSGDLTTKLSANGVCVYLLREVD